MRHWLFTIGSSAALLACAEGGDQTPSSSEVQVSANHYLWNLEAFRETGFPVDPAEVQGNWGTFALRSDSSYEVTIAGSSGVDEYALRQNGEMAILLVPAANRPKISFIGAYGLEGDTGIYYFTDRFSTGARTDPVGLFWGTRFDAAPPTDLAGQWHLFSIHVVFSSSTVFNPNNVGRATTGRLAFDGTGAITSGVGGESSAPLSSLPLTGSASGFADGRVDLSLKYGVDDPRSFLCSAATPTGSTVPNVVLGLNQDTSGGEAGLLAMVRLRSTATPADPARLAGTYHIGVQTIFVDATQPGTDVAHGTLTLNATGGFTLDAVGVGSGTGIAFSYSGTYIANDDGLLYFDVPATNETWWGAFTADYNTVVLVDNFVETRSGTKPPELNLGLALRQVTVP